MMNDRNDKFEGQDESEYHFSDDEMNYDLDEDFAQSEDVAAESAPQSSSKENIIEQMKKSKRMLISGAVFVGLVLVMYLVVSPSGTKAPSTDIVAAPQPMAASPQVAQAPAAAQQPAAAPAAPQVAAASPPAAAPSVAPAPAALPQLAQQAPPVAPQPTAMAPAVPASPQQQVAATAQSVVQAVTGALPQAGTGTMEMPQPSAIDRVLSVTAGQSQSDISSTSMLPGMNAVEAKIASVTANNERMMGQLQGQYTQQYNEFSNQNRATQEQIQALTARVSVMESQLNQLIQALTKRNATTSDAAPARSQQPIQAPDVKIAYNVQAIIPGRAWLKSDNGETLTVAEGDSIKGIGRVTKIDPYDGIVEINTGNRTVSLSYGESA